jgi:hypothetical protein
VFRHVHVGADRDPELTALVDRGGRLLDLVGRADNDRDSATGVGEPEADGPSDPRPPLVTKADGPSNTSFVVPTTGLATRISPLLPPRYGPPGLDRYPCDLLTDPFDDQGASVSVSRASVRSCPSRRGASAVRRA